MTDREFQEKLLSLRRQLAALAADLNMITGQLPEDPPAKAVNEALTEEEIFSCSGE